eukprot:466773-Prymnesium_polylepis.1
MSPRLLATVCLRRASQNRRGCPSLLGRWPYWLARCTRAGLTRAARSPRHRLAPLVPFRAARQPLILRL